MGKNSAMKSAAVDTLPEPAPEVSAADARTSIVSRGNRTIDETIGVMEHFFRPKPVEPFNGYGSHDNEKSSDRHLMNDPTVPADMKKALVDQTTLELHSRAAADLAHATQETIIQIPKDEAV